MKPLGLSKLVEKEAAQAIASALKPENYADAIKASCERKRDFLHYKHHCIERVKRGYSGRDVFDIPDWFSRIMPAMLEDFAKSTIGFPDNAAELHAKCCAVDFLSWKDAAAERRKGEGDDAYKARLFSSDVKRMAFLFNESDKERCSKKNPIKPVVKYHAEPAGKGLVEMVDDCTPAERRINDRWLAKENELDKYRADCMHIALQMFDIYFWHLWY